MLPQHETTDIYQKIEFNKITQNVHLNVSNVKSIHTFSSSISRKFKILLTVSTNTQKSDLGRSKSTSYAAKENINVA